MDQFRGYTVAGMLLVNYVGDMEAFHDVFKHHSVYFSYADSIMPSFFFAVGYSYRLTILRRLPQLGTVRTWSTYIRRSLSLILISLMFFGLGAGDEFSDWKNYSWQTAWHLVTTVIKSDLWETLALIGVTQIALLPVINKSLKFRGWTIVGCLIAHAVLSYLFNFNFSHQQPNALEDLLVRYIDWGATDKRCWESGPFGVLNWSVMMLLGSIAYDIIAMNSAPKSVRKLLTLGVVLMVVGYGISCLTRLYDVEKGKGQSSQFASSASADADDAPHEMTPWGASPRNLDQFATSPVLPPFGRAAGQDITSLLAEPPFVPPPGREERRVNYWMMTKQLPSPSFTLFASGFASALYALFVLACDIGPIRIGLFRTFGQNPLATYLLHVVVGLTLHTVSPEDAPLWFCLVSVTVFFLINYGIIRGLEKQGVYIRL